jgi:hypothetical protein
MKLFEISPGSRHSMTRGEQVMAFADYIEKISDAAGSRVGQYEEIGQSLFEAGFNYDDATFDLIADTGGSYQFGFPNTDDNTAISRGGIQCVYYGVRAGKKYEFSKQMSLEKIQLLSMPSFLEIMKKEAPRK